VNSCVFKLFNIICFIVSFLFDFGPYSPNKANIEFRGAIFTTVKVKVKVNVDLYSALS